eukprot:scaffold36625_cov59-Phaeocystis_antarctica.AAC.1
MAVSCRRRDAFPATASAGSILGKCSSWSTSSPGTVPIDAAPSGCTTSLSTPFASPSSSSTFVIVALLASAVSESVCSCSRRRAPPG